MAVKKLGLLARKSFMTTLCDNNGEACAVTVLEVPTNYIVQVKTNKTDGYNAVQVGIDKQKEHRMSKPLLGHFRKHKVPPLKVLKEFRLDKEPELNPGQTIDVTILKNENIAYIDVTGYSKGRGFAGMVKRWNKVMGPKTHGSMSVRAIGSVGSNTFPGRIRKGKKMPGRYGNEKVTIKNLKIFNIDVENSLILVKGAVPGPTGGLVVVKPSSKNFISKKVEVPAGKDKK
ncbi:MAG: 50S ribosomal protein L3 [Planctomycetota bacterium]